MLTAIAPIPTLSIERMLYNMLDADTLAHLAHLKRQADPSLAARRKLSPEGVEELATMLGEGRTPTIGFWRRRAA